MIEMIMIVYTIFVIVALLVEFSFICQNEREKELEEQIETALVEREKKAIRMFPGDKITMTYDDIFCEYRYTVDKK